MILLAPAWAQNTAACTTSTTRGVYGVTCSGFMSPAAGAPQVAFSALGTVTGDYSGRFTGTAKASLGGTIVDQTVSGTLVVNSDCTGSISYDQKINGQPAPKLNISTHTLDDGKEIRGMSVDAGATMICNLRLMSRSAP
jgi:hypothetical protein